MKIKTIKKIKFIFPTHFSPLSNHCVLVHVAKTWQGVFPQGEGTGCCGLLFITDVKSFRAHFVSHLSVSPWCVCTARG